MKLSLRLRLACGLCLSLLLGAASQASAAPLKIGYSDWPGWVAWQVAIDKGWFKAAGLDVDFEWFDYGASIDAFSAGKLDANLVTNGDALVIAGSGTKNTMIMVTDYSDGNDIIVAKPGIKTLKDLKGQKIGLEVGLVENLLLIDGLKKNGMTDADVQIVNVKTNETPQVLASGGVAAVGAWQPNAGEAMKALPGSRGVFTSAQEPGLIYDVLAVSPTLHAWLHGETQLDPNDSCAVVLFAHGLTPALTALTLLALALAPRRAVFPLPAPILVAEPAFDLPPGCGPPSS